MYDILRQTIDKHAPLIKKKIKGRDCPWLTTNLKKAMRDHDYLLTKARRTKCSSDWLTYKLKRNYVNNLLRKEKATFNKQMLNENLSKPQQFWKTIKKIYPNKKSSSTTSHVMKLNNRNDICTFKSKIANAFGKFFANVVQELKKSLNVFWKYYLAKFT